MRARADESDVQAGGGVHEPGHEVAEAGPEDGRALTRRCDGLHRRLEHLRLDRALVR